MKITFTLALIYCFLAITSCSTLKSVKDCGVVVDAYTKEQKDGRWECRTYNWFWD